MPILFILVTSLLFILSYSLDSVPLTFIMDGNYRFEYPIPYIIVSMLKIYVPSYLFFIELLIVCVLIYMLSFLKLKFKIFNIFNKNIWDKLIIILLAIALIEFAVTNYFFLDHIPHVPDSIAYATQAKIFSMKKLFLNEMPFSEHFALPGMIFHNEKWFSQYSFGHPLILSIGYAINIPWIIPPIVGTIGLLFTYLLGKKIYSSRAGFFVAFLLFCSPFYKMNAANFMSHNSALTVAVISVYLFIRMIKERKWKISFFSGLSFGLLFNIRPYTAVLILTPFIVFLLDLSVKEIIDKSYKFKNIIAFFCGLFFMILLYGFYNYALTDNIFISPYALGSTSQFGFSQLRSVNNAFYDIYINLFLLNKTLVGWPFGLAFLFFYSLTPIQNKWEFICIGIIIMLISGYFLYQGSWMMYGPRFWYEMLPFLFIIIVIGIEKFAIFLDSFIHKLQYKTSSTNFLFLMYFIYICLAIYSLGNWYQLNENPTPRWQTDYTPENIHELKGFDFASIALMKNIADKKISHAVVFIKPSTNLLSYGIPSYDMDLSFNGSIIYVRDLGDDKNKRIMNAFPDRQYYQGDYESGSIELYSK